MKERQSHIKGADEPLGDGRIGQPTSPYPGNPTDIDGPDGFIDTVRRAFQEFLFFPSLIILGFLLLAIITDFLDRVGVSTIPFLGALRHLLQQQVFSSPQATSSLLGSVATGLITVTSITFSLLLLALQQAASTLTVQIYDQFLHRRGNQFIFGYFVGLALYSLIIQATISAPFNPVFGASVAFVLAVIAMYLLIVLIYMAIDQMRPSSIVQAISRHIMVARQQEMQLVCQTRREPKVKTGIAVPVRTTQDGFVTWIDIGAIRKELEKAPEIKEVDLQVVIGSDLAYGQTIAYVKTDHEAAGKSIVETVLQAVKVDQVRDIERDPAYGIYQLGLIAWTSTSTAKSNPDPALQVIHGLQDILARWELNPDDPPDQSFPVVYRDQVRERIFDVYESLAVASSESMQHQTLSAIYRALAELYPVLQTDEQEEVNRMVLRMISDLGDQVLTAQLDRALSDMIEALKNSGSYRTAEALEEARSQLALSIGKLRSRSTRVPGTSSS